MASAPSTVAQPCRTSTTPATGDGNLFGTRYQLQLYVSSIQEDNSDLHRLKGPSFKVVVGPTDKSSFPNYETESWSLPKALICYQSPFLNAACNRDFRERNENCIYLPEDEPKIFGLYVEWMYYGTYTLGPQPNADFGRDVSTDAKAWVLGDKLLSVNFKNYAMRRLYTQYAINGNPKPVRITDIKYACMNSAVSSPLRRFFFDLATAHFHNTARIVGTAEEWDEFLQDHADVRVFLLGGFRMDFHQRQFFKTMDAYMEKEQVQPSASASGLSHTGTTPAKRTADGALVKEQASGT